jgi:hypothetical protein
MKEFPGLQNHPDLINPIKKRTCLLISVNPVNSVKSSPTK